MAGCFKIYLISKQVGWLHRAVLHAGPGPGLQLPGPAVWNAGLRQTRLTHHPGLHLQHWGHPAHGVSHDPRPTTHDPALTPPAPS